MYPQYVTYPHQRSQMPYTYDHPSFYIPSQMRVNPVRHFPAAYEPWSCGGNYGYQIPDSNNYFPPYHCSGYPHPYHPPPLPYFHDACCPSFYKMHHPVHYAPPPNYSMELPIYDYDKKPNWRCPHHLCCLGGDTKEEVTDAEKRTDSLPPAQSKNLPYPIVWVSPEEVNTAKQMHGGFTEPQLMNSSDHPRDSFKLEKGKRVENQKNLDGSQLPFPIIWIPYKPEEAEKKDHAEEQTTPPGHEEAGKKAHAEKQTTPPLMTCHEEVSPFKSSKESVDSNVAQATTMAGKNGFNHCKLIPVKQLDVKENNHNASQEPENELAKNSLVGGNKRSKLPPVCLRVEPLPKRKNGSGKSRSLSPPKRGKPEELVSESSATMGLKEDMKSAKENEQSKLAQVADDVLADPKANQAEMPCAGKEVDNSEAMDSKDQSMEKVENVKTKELTEVEAAIIIQSAYRGYEVRKWEPIKKLKEIGKVREELSEVKSRIKAMEFSSSSSDKEASLLGEMIMSLLLKLDTIQGLEPVTRDMRKSTAKELVHLQEEVDSVVNNKREDVNSPQMEMKTIGSEEVKVSEGKVEKVKVGEGEVEEDIKVGESEEEEDVKVGAGEVEVDIKVGESEEEEDVKVGAGEVEEDVKVGAGEVEEEVKVGEVEVQQVEEVKVGEGVVDACEKEEEDEKAEEDDEKAEVIALKETAEGDNGGVTDEGSVTSTTITTASSGEMLELKEEKGVEWKMNEVKETWGEEEKVLEMKVQADDEDTTMITSSSSGVDMEMNEEKVCEGEVETLMGEADKGGASDEGLGEDTCVITSTEIELKEEVEKMRDPHVESWLEEEEKEEKSSGDENVRLMMEKLVEKGKEQLEVITELSERIKMLEKKLAAAAATKKAAKKGKGWVRTKTRPRR